MADAILPGFDLEFLGWFRERTERAGARWLPGLPDAFIGAIEQQWAVRFPSDYRLFLRHLHAPVRPSRFSNWLTGTDEIHAAFDALPDGICFDVEHNDLWRPAWGERPVTPEARAAVVREQLRRAPRLIPIYGHRYLLAEPWQAGNPVLSIHQTDGIVYGANLRQYLFVECAGLLGIEPPCRAEALAGLTVPLESVPFWGELLC